MYQTQVSSQRPAGYRFITLNGDSWIFTFKHYGPIPETVEQMSEAIRHSPENVRMYRKYTLPETEVRQKLSVNPLLASVIFQ